MAEVSQDLGFRLVPVSMTMSELTNGNVPVIVHFEEGGLGRGRFLLYLGTNQTQSHVTMIDGAHVMRFSMPSDQFRRKWTGYALAVRPSPRVWPWLRRSATVLALAGMVVFLIRHPKQQEFRLRLFAISRRWFRAR
jgi:ABC-type bacteriocin/lantibiotic exporter with double-glycine peptidase domain